MNKTLLIQRNTSQCGVADYGRRLYAILVKHINIDFAEINGLHEYHTETAGYDTIIYNYHHATLPFINNDVISPNKKHIAIFHEAVINFTPDKIITTEIRPLFEDIELPTIKNDIPVVGSFGFGFPSKNFTRIAEVVRDTYDRARIRVNIPFAYYGDADGYLAMREVERMQQVLSGTNIELTVNHKYLPPAELLQFLRSNDINLFLYEQSGGGRGYSSAIDYALSVYKPIGVSDSEMFRHLPASLRIDKGVPWLIENWFTELTPVYERNSNKKLVEYYKTMLA